MRYQVTIHELKVATVSIEADSAHDAVQKAREGHLLGSLTDQYGDLQDVYTAQAKYITPADGGGTLTLIHEWD